MGLGQEAALWAKGITGIQSTAVSGGAHFRMWAEVSDEIDTQEEQRLGEAKGESSLPHWTWCDALGWSALFYVQ